LVAGAWLVDSALFVFAAGLGGLALAGLWPTHGQVLDLLDLAVGVLACPALWASEVAVQSARVASAP